MKKILTTFLAVFVMLSFITPNMAFAKKAKNEEKEINRMEYVNLNWWENFNDPVLSNYLVELFEKNTDLKIAALNVEQGEKLVKMSFANEVPHLSIDGDMGRVMSSSNIQYGSRIYKSYAQYQYMLPLTASYEIDIWGKNRFKTKSIKKQLKMLEQDEKSIYISLTSNFAANYYNYIKANKLLTIQEELVKIQEEVANKTQVKFENGLCTESDVIAEKKFLTLLEEELNNLTQTKTLLENDMRVYLSDSNKDITAIDYDSIQIPQNLPASFSTSVIEQRPDYIRSQENIEKIGYDTKIAKRELLPKFVIYGQIGFNSYHLSEMFDGGSQLANAGILPSLDLFSGGRKFAMLKLKKLEYEEALQKYQKTILTSIQEVNDNAVNLQTALQNFEKSTERKQLEDRNFELMNHKYEIGAASNLDLLCKQEKNLIAQKDEISNKINYLISIISMYKAVGGQDLYNLNNDEEVENI